MRSRAQRVAQSLYCLFCERDSAYVSGPCWAELCECGNAAGAHAFTHPHPHAGGPCEGFYPSKGAKLWDISLLEPDQGS